MNAREHLVQHSPGQQPGVQALLRWQAGDQAWRFVPAAIAAEASPPDATHFGWQAAAADEDDEACLGGLDLWAHVPAAAEWVDLTLSVHHAGRWLKLRPELEDAPGDDTQAPRQRLLLGDDDRAALAAAGLSMAMLRAAPRRAWLCRPDGLGAFVAGAFDLGWP